MSERAMKVRYTGATQEQVEFGSGADPRLLLQVGRVYEVYSSDVRSWHTLYTLKGVPGEYNSSCFEAASVSGGVLLVELEREARALVALLADRHPGLITWHEALRDKLSAVKRLVEEVSL